MNRLDFFRTAFLGFLFGKKPEPVMEVQVTEPPTPKLSGPVGPTGQVGCTGQSGCPTGAIGPVTPHREVLRRIASRFSFKTGASPRYFLCNARTAAAIRSEMHGTPLGIYTTGPFGNYQAFTVDGMVWIDIPTFADGSLVVSSEPPRVTLTPSGGITSITGETATLVLSLPMDSNFGVQG